MSRIAIWLSLTVMCFFLSFGQSMAQTQITLEEAVKIALEQNINIKQAQNNLERNDAAVRAAYGRFMPNLNGTLGASQSTGRQFNQATVTFNDFTQNSINGNLNTSIPLFSGWQNISNLRETETNREASQFTYERLRENVIFQTASSFLTVILNQQLLEISKENFTTVQKQLEQVEAQVEVGMRPIVDLFNQEAEVANSQLSVIQRQRDLNTSKVSLVRLLQLDALDEYEFLIPEVNSDVIIPQSFNVIELIEAALNSRNDIKAAELEVISSQYGLRGARSGYWPTISFNAGMSTSYSDQYRLRTPTGEVVTVGFSDQFFDQRINRNFGISMNIPIFDRFQTRTAVVNRRIDMKNQKLALEDQKSLVFQEVRQAYEDYQAFAQELVATDAALRAAEKAFETQQERYNVGSTTLLELTQSNNTFFQASSNRIQSIYRFIFQEKLLDFYLGRLTDEISL